MSKLKLPDGPQTHPWLQTVQWLTSPLEYMEDCAQRYGDIFTLRIGPVFTPQVLPVHPARKGALLGPGGGVQMVVRGRRSQNQRIFQTSSSSA